MLNLEFLMSPQSSVYTLFILSIVIALGIVLGAVKIFNVRLGVAGVLFSGLLLGHFKWAVDGHLLEFIREFGLILFVYTIGLQVGPGFLVSLKKQGLKLNLLAVSVVFLGTGIAVLLVVFNMVPLTEAVGILAGATTNTPSLGAAQEAFHLKNNLFADEYKIPSLAYAVAYPFGIMGVILTMVFVKGIFKVRLDEESKRYEEETGGHAKEISSVSLQVENKNLDGLKIKDIPFLKEAGVVISRVMQGPDVVLSNPEMILHLGDVVHVVGPKEKIKTVYALIGSVSTINLRLDVVSDLVSRKIAVTNRHMVGKTIEELSISNMYHVTITRIDRSEVEFTATDDITIQLGDFLQVVGEKHEVEKFAVSLGDSPKELRKPYLLPIFIGIAFGLFLGSIPLYIPGIPVAVKLGLAGGPLLAAIFFSNIYRIGPVIWFIPESSNWMLREIGISLFLGAVGLRAGDKFFETLTNGHGLQWIFFGAIITFVPIFIVSLIGRKFYKMNYHVLCGLLAGSMTDPPALAFANSQSQSTAVSVAYANVYPLVMILRVISVQVLVLLLN